MRISAGAVAEMVGAKATMNQSISSGWSIDSRTLNPGDFFIALRGPKNDGHDHVAAAFARDASIAIVEREIPGAGPQIVVPDSLAALQTLAAKARMRWAGKVIGVTGSAGKTTTKDIIAALVSAGFRTGRTVGNLNNEYGVPVSLLRLPDDAEAAVIEMGMNHAGEIAALAKIAKPQIGVVTNVGWAHAENFEDGIDGIARAKKQLIDELPTDGIAVLNADDERVRTFGDGRKTVTFGFAAGADVRAENVRLSQAGAKFQCLGIEFESPLAGRHEVSNVLAGIAVAHAMGIAPERLLQPVRNLTAGKMRGERLERNGITVINDSYNANPEAMRSMLELLRDTPARRRIAVLGEMLELGREAESLHRGTGKFAAEQGIDALLGIRGAARYLVDEAREALSGGAAYFFDTPEEAGDALVEMARAGDVILFKGSRGVQVERALDRLMGSSLMAPAGTAVTPPRSEPVGA